MSFSNPQNGCVLGAREKTYTISMADFTYRIRFLLTLLHMPSVRRNDMIYKIQTRS
jgi:hypothetical protein